MVGAKPGGPDDVVPELEMELVMVVVLSELVGKLSG